MALTQVSTDGIKNGTITGSDLATNFATTGDFTFTGDNANIIFDKDADNIRVFDGSSIDFGNSGDLKIHHTGNVNIIDDVQSKTISIQRGGTEQWKFGDGTFRGPDNKKIQLGNAQDLQIFHDGSNSKIVDSGTGSLLLLSNSFKVQNAAGTENQIIANENGTVDIYYDNVRKFRTNSTGVQIGTTSAPLLLDNLTSGDGGQDIGRVGLNRDNNSTSDRQIWNQYTVAPTVAKFNIFARPANDTGTAGNYLEVDPVNNNFDLPRDNLNLRIGASADLQIFHNGTDSRIVNTTGDLSVRGGVIKLASTTGEEYIRCTANSSVDLFHDNVVKLTTNSDGYRSNDNVKAQFGVGSDLQIYHDGSNSIIDSLTGDFYFRNRQASNGRFIFEAAIGEVGLLVNNNGSVDLYYDNSKKFETSSTGVTITGRLNMTEGIDIPDGGDNNTSLSIGSGNDLRLYHDGSNSFIKDRGTGNLYIRGDDTLFIQSDSGEDKLKATTNGSIELYFDNSKKFETTSYGARVFGNFENHNGFITVKDDGKFTVGNSDDLQIYHDGSNSFIDNSTGGLFVRANTIKLRDAAGNEDYIEAFQNGSVRLYYDNSKKFETDSNGVTISGRLLMGDSSGANDDRIRLGADGDLSLYHNGTNSVIENATGALVIKPEGLMRIQDRTTDEFRADFNDNGSVDLYYNGSKKLETTGNGVAIGGATSVDQHLHIENSSGDAMIRLRGSTNYGVLFTKHSDASLTGYVGSGGAVNLGASNIGISASLAGGMIKFQTGGTSASNERVAINSSGMMTFDGGGSSYPWGGSFREDGSGSDNSVRLFFEGDNGVSNRTFSIMSENGKLRVSGGGTAGSATGSQLVYLASTSSTSWTSGSDIRLKENITEIPNVLNKIKNYRCARFNFKGDDASDIQNIKFGFIAQDWLTDFPEVISKSTQDADDPTDTTEYYGMQYTETIPVLLKAIQELFSKVEVLETEVAALKAA